MYFLGKYCQSQLSKISFFIKKQHVNPLTLKKIIVKKLLLKNRRTTVRYEIVKLKVFCDIIYKAPVKECQFPNQMYYIRINILHAVRHIFYILYVLVYKLTPEFTKNIFHIGIFIVV